MLWEGGLWEGGLWEGSPWEWGVVLEPWLCVDRLDVCSRGAKGTGRMGVGGFGFGSASGFWQWERAPFEGCGSGFEGEETEKQVSWWIQRFRNLFYWNGRSFRYFATRCVLELLRVLEAGRREL